MDIDEEIVEYEYDGEHLDTEEMEMKIQDDGTYTIVEEEKSEDLKDDIVAQNVSSNSFQRFRWTPHYVKLLIKGYFDRRHKFKDPKNRKKYLWHEIYLELRKAGLPIDEDSLDKKWRNLKKTFSLIRDKVSHGNLGRGVRWEHYELFEMLYAEDESEIDKSFLEEYFSNLDFVEEDVIGEVKANGDPRFAWCPDSVDFLLKSYLDKKQQFRDPRTKKKKLWSQIWQEMMLAGFDVGNEDMVDRKMRNLKKSYKELRKTKGYEPITWEYYDRLDELFSDDPVLNDAIGTDSFDAITDTQGAWTSSSDEEQEDNSVLEPVQDTAGSSTNNNQQQYDCSPKPTEDQPYDADIQNEPNSTQQYNLSSTSTEDQTAIQNTVHSAHNWCPKSTKLFLKCYIKRKKKFRDPGVIRTTLWNEILQEMNAAGYHIENIQILITKMQNMTKTFKTIREKNKKGTGQGQIRWEHLAAFEKLYSNDNIPQCTAAPLQLENPLSLDQTLLTPVEEIATASNRVSALHSMRKRQLSVEERKALMTEQVHETLKETNKLLQERNELLRQLIRMGVKK